MRLTRCSRRWWIEGGNREGALVRSPGWTPCAGVAWLPRSQSGPESGSFWTRLAADANMIMTPGSRQGRSGSLGLPSRSPPGRNVGDDCARAAGRLYLRGAAVIVRSGRHATRGSAKQRGPIGTTPLSDASNDSSPSILIRAWEAGFDLWLIIRSLADRRMSVRFGASPTTARQQLRTLE